MEKRSLTCNAKPYRRYTRENLVQYLKRNGLALQEVRKNVGTKKEEREYYIEDARGSRVGMALAKASRGKRLNWDRMWWDAHRKVERSL